ncbi:MAG: hypothetical protein ACI4SB_01455, partial [Acutalibacteraceae bacterium]
MKKTIRAIAVVLCVMMIASSLYGCTMKISISYKTDAQPVANNSVVVEPTAAPVTQAPTAAPTTEAPTVAVDASTPDTSDTSTSDTSTSDASTPDASGSEAADASANAVPTTKEEIVAEYAKVYNATKATGTFLGKDTMECESIIVDGKDNGTLKNLAGKFLSANGTDMPLPPYSDDNPANECLITAADVQDATYVDNGDGTATIKITPVETTNDKKFQGAQGK